MNIPAVSQTKPICIVVSKKLFFFKKKKKIRAQYWLWHPCCFFELHQKIKQKNTLNVVNITDTILVQIKMWNVYRRRRVRTHSNGNNSHDSLSKVSLKVLCFVHDFTHKITPWNILFIWKWNINMEMSKDMAQIFIRQCIHRKTVTF